MLTRSVSAVEAGTECTSEDEKMINLPGLTLILTALEWYLNSFFNLGAIIGGCERGS